ncbi:BTAD domain-containing putative transcriptional regulator [Curvibacter gracilis]|uniref:BTAD domain-containing putative transcriptional regulator n=1 Tax=Curvibacter gracilis TaxID=230310 RepID=UPI000484BFFC|nr:AAA family ATPase [Curvibacter gracilis]
MRFFGPFEVRLNEGPALAFPYDKVRALLAYLALEPGEHTREALAQLLWPDLQAEQARANLRRCVFDLRRCLGPAGGEWVSGGPRALRLSGPASMAFDVPAFERSPTVVLISPEELAQRLEQRLALYRGPLLSGLSLPDAPEFEAWLQARRDALHRQALALLEELITHHEQRHETARALQHARRAIELEPWRESLQRSCMRLLARHSPEAALAHFDTFERQLEQELGVRPSPQTLQLADQIQRQCQAPTGTERPPRLERRRLVALVAELDLINPGEDAPTLLQQALAGAVASLQTRGAHVALAERAELLAYFGHPVAREQAPREAAEAALDLAAALQPFAALSWRVGLHAGWSHDSSEANRPDETGTLAREARRLAWQAPARGLVLGQSLHRRLHGHYQLSLGEGPDKASHALLLARQPAPQARNETEPHPPRLLGRQSELAQLGALWHQVAQSGQAAGLLLRAEPGLGKSRLAATLARQVQYEGATVLTLRCQAESAHTPYFALLESVPHWLGLDTDGTTVSEPRLGTALAALGLNQPDHLGRLLGLLDNRPLPQDGAGQDDPHPAERKRHEQALLCELMARLGRGQALLLWVEDLHWADPATLETLARLLGQGGPVLLLATSRQALPPALAHSGMGELSLGPLSTHAARELAQTLAEPQALSEAWQAAIVSRADGVPLFVEELTRAWLAGLSEQVPDSLWDVLAARLDSLGPAKRIAQLAAAIGRDFSDSLLLALGEPAEQVAAGLEALLRSGLLRRQRSGAYHFKHALVRDAAYQSLPQAERRAIHARLAQVLRTHFAERLQAHPEILAHHLSEATDPGAAQAWLAAGRQAAARSAHAEALHDFQAGLAALQALPPTEAYRVRTELDLQVALGTLLVATEGYGSEAAKTCFMQAWALSALAPPEQDRFPLMWGLWMVGRSSADEHPLEFADRLRDQAGASPDAATQLAVAYAYGNNTLWLGELVQAQAHLEAAVALSRQVSGSTLVRRFGEDIGVAARALLSWVCWLQGRLEAARALAQENVQYARRLDHAHSLGYALGCAAVLHRHLGDLEGAAALSHELLAHGQRHQLLLWQAGGATVLGWTLATQGDDRGLDTLHQGVAGARQAFRIIELTFMHILADALLRLGRSEEALAVTRDALTRAQANHDLHLVADFLRLQGDALLLQPHPSHASEAAGLYQQGWQQAQAQGAYLLALRCATALARLWQGTDRQAEAQAGLSQALARVDAPPHWPDVQAARQALNPQPSLEPAS